ncbi:MAG: DNA topoisomerase VI subunit B [Acidobacteria bacterium]|nr:DNA topoisomerase VI subunit B [Acidobacteriota bacterium]
MAKKQAGRKAAVATKKTGGKSAAKRTQLDLFAGEGAAVSSKQAPIPAPAPVPAPAAPARSVRRENAESMASRQREISVSEFFTKNRHLLGFDNPAKALLTATKEAVDNSLDACEEAGILPDLEIVIDEIEEERFRLTVTDNGPGIVKNQIPRIFGQLLYGSKFHALKQSRGQQGIGISAAGMYAQLTTGKPVRIVSRTARGKPAHQYEIAINTAKNAPQTISEGVVEWDRDHGTRVSMELAGVYKKGRRSLDDYVAQTAQANPHAEIVYRSPKGEEFRYERIANELPKEPLAIKPHPYGVELGILMRMMKESRGRSVAGALQSDFSRVSSKVATEICQAAGVAPGGRPVKLTPAEVERIFKAIPKIRIMSPPTNCLSPIGAELIEGGLRKSIAAEFYAAATRSPAVYRGNPFQVEVGLAYGGQLPGDEPVDLWRFANRVPLQYQQSACAITRSVITTDWKKYGLQQARGALPAGAMVLFVHIASVWVPFTSESKEAVATYPEIVKEIRLGLQECGRRLGAFLSRRRRLAEEEKKKSYIEQYIPHIGIALREILGFNAKDEAKLVAVLKDTLERSRTI